MSGAGDHQAGAPRYPPESRPWFDDPEVVAAAQGAFDGHDLGDVRSVGELIEAVSRKTHKPIQIRTITDADLVTTTALWVEFPDRSLIVLRTQDPPYYRARGLLHEIGHILFQHPACTVLDEDPRLERYRRDGGEIRGRVLISEANLPALYANDRSESEAEAVAVLIGRQLMLRSQFHADETVFG